MPLPEHERQETLRLLKLKWAEVNTLYQKLPFSLDTASKMQRCCPASLGPLGCLVSCLATIGALCSCPDDWQLAQGLHPP